MKRDRKKKIIIKGSELLDMGKLFDDKQKAIDSDLEYDVRIDKYSNYMSILSLEDRECETFDNYLEKMKEYGGYVSLEMYYKKMGLIESVSEFFSEAESIIDFYGKKEYFQKAIYLRDELQSLKKYYKYVEQINGKK
jgi:hypothetical protein